MLIVITPEHRCQRSPCAATKFDQLSPWHHQLSPWHHLPHPCHYFVNTFLSTQYLPLLSFIGLFNVPSHPTVNEALGCFLAFKVNTSVSWAHLKAPDLLHWTHENCVHLTLLPVSGQRHVQRHLSQAAGGVVHGQLFLYLSPRWPVGNIWADGESILNALLSLSVLKRKVPLRPPCWAIDLLLVDFLVVTSIDVEERETDKNDQQEAHGQRGALILWFLSLKRIITA